MAHSDDILQILGEWKNKRFRDSEITLTQAATSLSSNEPLIVARPGTSQSRWILTRMDTKKVAVLTHAGICAWTADLNTGNYVPQGHTPPPGLPENRIQDVPSYKCEYTYPFETGIDASFWNFMKDLEHHALSRDGFNKGGKKRRSWQSGVSATNRQRYLASSKIFVKRTPYNTTEDGNFNLHYEAHPWILNAVHEFPDTNLIPNPERPRYYDYTDEDKIMRDLQSCNIPYFERGDIIWMSFKVGFVVSGDVWWSEIIPLELVRVGKLPESFFTTSDPAMYPPVDPEFTPFESNRHMEAIDGPVQLGKRKERSSDHIEQLEEHPNKKALIQNDPDNVDDIEDGHDEQLSFKINNSGRRSKTKKGIN